MNSSHRAFRRRGFTLIELLVVIAIIAILAGLLLPTLATVKTRTKVTKAKLEMKDLDAAIKAYEAEYNRFPASKAAETASTRPPGNPVGDFTYGTAGVIPPVLPNIGTPDYPQNNSEVMEILLDIDRPGGPNQQHKRNPRQHVFFHAKMVPGGPGISTTDYVFRDPWGNPYIISMDMDGDNKCADAFYRQKALHPPTGPGYYGLTRRLDNDLELNGQTMIWSFGPDGQADPGVQANSGVNKDNVLGWQ